MYGIKSAKTVMYLVSKNCLKFSNATAPIAYSHANNILSFNKKEREGERERFAPGRNIFKIKGFPVVRFAVIDKKVIS